MSDSSSDLVPRLVTAAIGIPILLYLIFWAPKWAFYLLVLAAGSVSVWEYCSVTYGEEHVPGKVVATLTSVGIISTIFFAPAYMLEAVLGSVATIAIFFLFSFRDKKRVSHQIAASVTGMLYGGVFLGVLIPVHNMEAGSFWILLTLCTVWMSDTSAYFAGRAFGSHSLYKSVSPNKSVEGSIGGLLGSVALAFGCNYGFAELGPWTPLSPGTVLLLTIPAVILGQIGDLAVSLVKRAHDVKDTGTILYGHGGLLDRIDGLIYAAPWFYVCVVRWLPNLQG